MSKCAPVKSCDKSELSNRRSKERSRSHQASEPESRAHERYRNSCRATEREKLMKIVFVKSTMATFAKITFRKRPCESSLLICSNYTVVCTMMCTMYVFTSSYIFHLCHPFMSFCARAHFRSSASSELFCSTPGANGARLTPQAVLRCQLSIAVHSCQLCSWSEIFQLRLESTCEVLAHGTTWHDHHHLRHSGTPGLPWDYRGTAMGLVIGRSLLLDSVAPHA